MYYIYTIYFLNIIPNIIWNYLRPQESLLHSSVCSELPMQSLPPSNGGGVLHSLTRFLYPIPHDFVQPEYELHGPQRPLAAIKVFILDNLLSNWCNVSINNN